MFWTLILIMIGVLLVSEVGERSSPTMFLEYTKKAPEQVGAFPI